jgi:hypothetical protein
MRRRTVLLGYQLLTAASDTGTGLLLLVAPAATMRLMELHPPAEALPFLAYIGAFVLSTGLACLWGARLVQRSAWLQLETVWLLTAITRLLVAFYVEAAVLQHTLEPGWITVACTDGLFAAIQLLGLARGWLRDAR